MVQWYTKWNRKLLPLLWGLVIIGLLASLPLVLNRVRTEVSSKKVEFVFDYRDLLDIADFKPNPRIFVNEQLKNMKQAGIQSLAVYESTLNELKLSRRIELFSSHEAAALTQSPISPTENFAYILFSEAESQSQVKEIIERGFQRQNVKIRPWSYKNQQGIVLEMAMEEALLKPLDPDPITLKMLKEKEFQIVVRLSNRRQPFDAEDMERMLSLLSNYGVKTIIVDGEAVPGYEQENKKSKAKSLTLTTMAQLLNKYDIGLANIELTKAPQKGFNTLAKETDYNVLRLHSFTEKDGEKLTENLEPQELEQRIQGVADRFVLAVKDRNIRMIFLNAKPSKNIDKGKMTDPLAAIYESLTGNDGAIQRIQAAGFTLGTAHSFRFAHSFLDRPLKLGVVLGSIALLALTLSYFIPSAVLFLFAVGLIGAGGLTVVAPNILYKLLALGAGISAPTIAIILAIRWFRRHAEEHPVHSPLREVYRLFLQTVGITLFGAVFVIALLNDITYTLVIDQFKGVNVLALTPIVLAGLYLLFFSEGLNGRQILQKVKRMLSSTISVLWILTVIVILGVGYYYLSRTGNEGQASTTELLFRSLLENVLGVRPRTKEFLIGHPLFILGAYVALKKHFNGVYVLLLGAISLASVVGTFTHLHTPLYISLIRVSYGVIFGAIIGLLLIGVWEISTRGWKKWVQP